MLRVGPYWRWGASDHQQEARLAVIDQAEDNPRAAGEGDKILVRDKKKVGLVGLHGNSRGRFCNIVLQGQGLGQADVLRPKRGVVHVEVPGLDHVAVHHFEGHPIRASDVATWPPKCLAPHIRADFFGAGPKVRLCRRRRVAASSASAKRPSSGSGPASSIKRP